MLRATSMKLSKIGFNDLPIYFEFENVSFHQYALSFASNEHFLE